MVMLLAAEKKLHAQPCLCDPNVLPQQKVLGGVKGRLPCTSDQRFSCEGTQLVPFMFFKTNNSYKTKLFYSIWKALHGP